MAYRVTAGQTWRVGMWECWGRSGRAGVERAEQIWTVASRQRLENSRRRRVLSFDDGQLVFIRISQLTAGLVAPISVGMAPTAGMCG